YVYPGAPHVFRNNVCRYNISANDGRRNGFAAIYVGNDGSGVSDLEIYQNTVYVGPAPGEKPPNAVLVRGPTRVRFRNNLFQSSGGVPLLDVTGDPEGLLFQGNDYWATPASNGGGFVIRWEGSVYGSLDAWRAATGQEKLGDRNTGLSVDPMLA